MFSAESKMLCLLVVLMKIGQLAGSSGSTCRSGSLDGYAFCCCKEVVIPTLSSTSFVNTAMLSTTSAVFATQAITATPSATNASTATISAAISPTVSVTPSASVSTVTASPIPTPQPAFNDSCFVKVDINYAAYNECYCGYTRRNYVAFNGSHYSDTNRTDYQYSCWKLPKPKLYIGGLFNSKSDVGRRILPAADVAIDEINKDESILPAYDLEILTHNTTKKEQKNKMASMTSEANLVGTTVEENDYHLERKAEYDIVVLVGKKMKRVSDYYKNPQMLASSDKDSGLEHMEEEEEVADLEEQQESLDIQMTDDEEEREKTDGNQSGTV
eukprot:gene677-1505_t